MFKLNYLFLLLNFCVFGQSNFDIRYKVAFVFEEKDTKNEYVAPLLERAKNAEKDLKFTLTYSDGISKFSKDDTGIKTEEMEIASVFADADNNFYSDLSNKIDYMEVIQNELFGKNEFVVKEERKINWTLVDSTKTIANFKCYYAFAVIKKEKRGSTKDLKIEAWYTPEIPISIGPKGYNQLPGLIIQLKENKTVFIAEKLEVVKKRKKIELPTLGKIINHDQYVEIFKERSAKADLLKRE